jgi:hypothetical protein
MAAATATGRRTWAFLPLITWIKIRKKARAGSGMLWTSFCVLTKAVGMIRGRPLIVTRS